MAYALFIFLLTALISFSISLQAGPVTVSVMRFAMHKQKDAAFMTAIGGSMAELMYAILAVLSAEALYIYIQSWEPITYVGPIIMISFGIYLIISANKKFLKGRKTSYDKGSPFLTGLKLGLKNPQIYLFYCGVLLAYFQFGFKPASVLLRYLSFGLGAMIGFWLLLMLIMYLVKRQGRISNHYFRGSKVIYLCGTILIVAGIVQLVMAL